VVARRTDKVGVLDDVDHHSHSLNSARDPPRLVGRST
jgi:hypothetical protein